MVLEGEKENRVTMLRVGRPGFNLVIQLSPLHTSRRWLCPSLSIRDVMIPYIVLPWPGLADFAWAGDL